MKYVLLGIITVSSLFFGCNENRTNTALTSEEKSSLQSIKDVKLKYLTAPQKKVFLSFLRSIDIKKLTLASCDVSRLLDTGSAICRRNHEKCVKAVQDHITSDEFAQKADDFIKLFAPNTVGEMRAVFSNVEDMLDFEAATITCDLSQAEADAYKAKREQKFSPNKLDQMNEFVARLYTDLAPDFVAASKPE